MTTFTGLFRCQRIKLLRIESKKIFPEKTMRKRKRLSIRTETRELLLIRRHAIPGRIAWCHQCQTEVDWLSLVEITDLKGLKARELFRLVETEAVHFHETPEGHLFICLNSLITKIGEK
jgi:hypothetical protein